MIRSSDSPPVRNYAALPACRSEGDVVRALWEAFRTRSDGDGGYSWVGFYLGPGGKTPDAVAGPAEMILSVREPKPACSPISLHGACGRSYRSGRGLVVRDVRALGENYIACDPRDRSEVVVPYFDREGRVIGVLDVDAFDVDAFSEADAVALADLLRRSGVCAGRTELSVDVVG